MKSLLFSAAAILALCIAGAAQASESDVMLFEKDPGESKAYACFARHYDAVHLQTHRKQNVRDMVLFVHSYVDADPDSGRQYAMQLGITFRKFKTSSRPAVAARRPRTASRVWVAASTVTAASSTSASRTRSR